MSKPNVVLFMVDQLSAKWLEGQSADVINTPNLDRLRARGVTFSNSFVSNPICMACRSTLATGLTSRGHGVLANGYRLNPAIPTFMQLLQGEGWQTAAFGKVHFVPHFEGLYPDYRQYGFDVTHITEDSRGGEWLDWVAAKHPEHYDAVLATIWSTEIAEFGSYGPTKEDLSKRIEDLRARGVGPKSGHYPLPFPEEVSQTAWITSLAADYIRTVNTASPFFAQISYVQPHSPFSPPGEYLRHVSPERIPEPAGIEWIGDTSAPECFGTSEGVRTEIPANWREIRQHYFADIVHLDAQLGIVLDRLEERGVLDDTCVIFLSDHGELLLDHGFTGKGERHYDACIRVPLVITGPGMQNGERNESFVQHEDIFPTILEMAGIAPPTARTMGPYLKETPEYLPGRSLIPLCRGEIARSHRDEVYVESYNNIDSSSSRNWARTVRDSRWRYTYFPNDSGEQLFDLVADPDEQHNLAGDPACADERNRLRERLLNHVIMQDYPQTPRDLFALGVH
jgi:arylsulfatase